MEASLKLLRALTDDTPPRTCLLAQAAVRCFIIEDDADSDLDFILGLDDDAEGMNTALRSISRPDWLVELA